MHNTTTDTAVRSCAIDGWHKLPDTRPHVCLPCENRMYNQLDYLETTLPILRVIVRTEPTRTGELDLGAMDLTLHAHPHNTGDPDDQIGHTPISTVLGRHLEDWGLATADDIRPGEAIALIRDNLRRACQHNADVDQLADNLRQLYAQTRVALHRDWRPTRYAAPCPYDGGRLTRPAGDDTIECDGCPRLWDEDDYEQMAISSAPDHVLLYAHEIATALKVPSNRIHQLRHRGRLAQADVDADGRPLYELGTARQVLHKIELWRANAGELITWRTGQAYAPVRVRAGTEVEIAGALIVIRRGATVTIGPVTGSYTVRQPELVPA